MPAVLALFGLGSFAGVTVGGRWPTPDPMPLLVPGGRPCSSAGSCCSVGADRPGVALVLVFVQGTLSFAVGSTLISQVLYAAAGAPTLGGGFATAALNVGAAIGPWCGGAHPGRGPRLPLAALGERAAGGPRPRRGGRGGHGGTRQPDRYGCTMTRYRNQRMGSSATYDTGR